MHAVSCSHPGGDGWWGGSIYERINSSRYRKYITSGADDAANMRFAGYSGVSVMIFL